MLAVGARDLVAVLDLIDDRGSFAFRLATAAVNRRRKLLYSSRIAIVTLRVTTSRVEPDIVILHLFGSMTIGVETYDLEWLVRDLIQEGERKLIFDLAGVDQIDADAALFLVRCFFAARGSGGELRFAAARPDVVRPFHATMLDTLLSFDPTVTFACERFRASSQPG